MKEYQKLIQSLHEAAPLLEPNTAELIADFILYDRRRIIEPLIIHNKFLEQNPLAKQMQSHAADMAINQTLSNAGIGQEG